MDSSDHLDGIDTYHRNGDSRDDPFEIENLSDCEISQLVTILDETETEHVRITAARHLCEYAQEQPAVVASHAPVLIDQLGTSTAVCQHIAAVVMHALTTPEPFVETAPDLRILLNSGNSVVRNTAARALGRIATVAPEAVILAVDELIALVDDPAVRTAATDALARIGDRRPAAITPATEPVLRQCRDLPDGASAADDWDFRIAALEVIASTERIAPAAGTEVSAILRDTMRNDHWNVRRHAVETVSIVLSERPETFTVLEPDLRAGLDDTHPRVRQAAALAYIRIALTAPTAVGEPAVVAERLQILGEECDLPSTDLEQALRVLDPPSLTWRPSEYQLHHSLTDDIMVVPLKHSGDSTGTPPGSKRAIEFTMDRSVLVLGETGSGKTEAIKVLAHQMQTTPAEPFVIFDYKQDYQQFYDDDDTIRISIRDSTQFWNIFREIETEDELEEIGRMLFKQNEERARQRFFPQAARHLTVAALKYVYREFDSPSNEVFAQFLDSYDVESLYEKLTEYEDLRATASSITPESPRQAAGVFATLQVVLKSIFTGDFRKDGSFSIREYMEDPNGQKLIFDFPIKQGERIKPLYQLFVDWSIRYGLADERKSYYLLDEFSVLPRFDMLERLINAGRSYNCYAILGVQSIAQMRTRYDDETDSLLSGLAQEIHLRVGDQAGLEYWRQRMGRRRVERSLGDRDTRVSEEYPIGEDTIQNLAPGEGIVHTTEGWQRGRLYLFDEVKDALLPAETTDRTESGVSQTDFEL